MDGVAVYANNAALPRARLVSNTQVLPSAKAVLARIREGDFEPARLALLTAPAPANLPSRAPHEDIGDCQVLERTATHVKVQVSARHDSVLVLADSFYPGWKAFIDGEESAIFPVYHLFRGVVAPAGDYEVVFEYQPASFHIPLRFSAATLVFVLVLTAWGMYRRRYRPGTRRMR